MDELNALCTTLKQIERTIGKLKQELMSKDLVRGSDPYTEVLLELRRLQRKARELEAQVDGFVISPIK